MGGTANCPISCRIRIFFFLFLILVAPALAFDCSTLGDLEDDCIELQNTNPEMVPDLIYTSHRSPDHSLIKEYNDEIEVTPTQYQSSGNIKNAWLEAPYIYPSVIYNDQLLSNQFVIRADYDFDYTVPSNYYSNRERDGRTCKILYYHDSHSADVKIYSNGRYLTSNLNSMFVISKPSNLLVEVKFTVKIREKHYEWDRYCCRRYDGHCVRYCYDCDYDYTTYDTDTLTLSRTFQIHPYNYPESPSYTFIYEYGNQVWGDLSDYESNLFLQIEDSEVIKQKHLFYARFIEPFEFIQLYATDDNFSQSNWIYYDNDLIVTQKSEECTLDYSDLFKTYEKECIDDIEPYPVVKFKKQEPSSAWGLLFKIAVFVFINIIIYHAIRKYWTWL